MAGQQETFTLYKKADIEGYLEKIGSGASRWLSGKSRMWCELYGTILYMFKDSRRTSTGSQQLDMTQVHMVRRSTNDKSGVQFEILSKDKQHTFSTSSVGECDNWIRNLQAAMTLKDQENAPAQSRTVTVGVGDYEDIVLPESKTSSTPCIRIGASSTTDPGYCDVEFQNPPAPSSSQTSSAASAASNQVAEVGDDGYSTVEFRPKSGSGQLVVQLAQLKSKEPVVRPSEPPAGRPIREEDSAGYTKVEMRKKSLTEVPPQPCQSGPVGGEAESKEGEPYTYATVQRKTTPATQAGKVEDSARALPSRASEGSSDDDDQLISTAQSQHDPIPPFPYSLQPADLEPLAALQEFLSSNRKICRPSYADRTVTEDPVGDLKRVLEKLSL